MPRRKTEFSRALVAARAMLKAKTKERDRAIKRLHELNSDIPNLERTVIALEHQLKPLLLVGEVVQKASSPKVNAERTGTPDSRPGDEIPPEVRAMLPPEDFTGMGSHFAPPEDDFLPEITGDDPTKAKSELAKVPTPTGG